MTAAELIARLQKLPPDQKVMILDGFNAGGCPRDINFGPTPRIISEEHANDSADCEGRVGEVVSVMGYGCY